MSRSLHELSTAAHPGPEDSGASSPPESGYFGWQVIRRMQEPSGFEHAPEPGLDGRVDATPRQIAETVHGFQLSRRQRRRLEREQRAS